MNKKQNLKLLKALSVETRYKIIEVLLNNEICACKIPILINKTQSNTSMHLSKLTELNIVKFRKIGKTSLYSIKDKMIYDIFKIFGYVIDKK